MEVGWGEEEAWPARGERICVHLSGVCLKTEGLLSRDEATSRNQDIISFGGKHRIKYTNSLTSCSGEQQRISQEA